MKRSPFIVYKYNDNKYRIFRNMQRRKIDTHSLPPTEIITVNILADFENALFPVWKWAHAMLISYSDLWTSFL